MSIIENCAFFDCESLTSVDIPESITHIEERAFFGCKSLLGIEIPNGMTRIEDGTFGSCKNLASIEIPESVTHIGDGAFSGCGSLSSIYIPSSVSSIENVSFVLDCDKLEKIIMAESNPVYESDDVGMLYNKGKTTLICCPAGTKETSIKIPISVNYIKCFAFFGGDSLKDVYYAGRREQWDAIEIDMYENYALELATIHYGST